MKLIGRKLGRAVLAVVLCSAAGCLTREETWKEGETASREKFGGQVGCFYLANLDGSKVEMINQSRCRERFSPCSTFKIPNSLIGLETGVVPDADTTWKWDGVVRERAETNQDHTLRTAMKYSVLWFYQEVARQVGARRMQDFIDQAKYGNRDLSGGLTTFWLGSSLRISAEEQVDFLRRLHKNELPVSERSRNLVLDIMTQRRDEKVICRGKTGSNWDRSDRSRDLGWWVGSIEKDGEVWLFAANASGPEMIGPNVRTYVETILTEKGLL